MLFTKPDSSLPKLFPWKTIDDPNKFVSLHLTKAYNAF